MSFASEPERDDGNLPPVHIVIPDDARELDRDVLAYRRELRAQRRRQRIMRLFRPFSRGGPGGHSAILPLVATCAALALFAGAMLSVITISPSSAPTLARTAPASSAAATQPAGTVLTGLPAGTVQLDNRTVPVQSLVSSALALVPAGCNCGPALRRLAGQAAAAGARLYFVGAGTAPQLAYLTAHYGGGTAEAVYDRHNVLGAAYHPRGLTVILVYRDGTARVHRALPADFQLGQDLRELKLPGSRAVS